MRWGTTDHLAPYPKPVHGEQAIGLPPLKRVQGDHLGNIRRLIDLNLNALENAGVNDASLTFDAASGTFLDAAGNPVSREGIAAVAAKIRARDDAGQHTGDGVQPVQGDAGVRSAGGALVGGKTLARAAVYRALLREASGAGGGADGRRDGILARVASLASNSPPTVARLFDLSRKGGDHTPDRGEAGGGNKFPPKQRGLGLRHAPGWAMPDGTRFDNFKYKFQDKQVDLKRAIEAIGKDARAIEDRFDAYLQEERFHGRAAKRVDDFAAEDAYIEIRFSASSHPGAIRTGIVQQDQR